MSLKVTKNLNSLRETAKIAKTIADFILGLGPGPEQATVIALVGDLGAGKTTFTKNFLKELGVKEKVISPTFIIMKSFNLNKRTKRNSFKNIYHIDAYRVESKDLTSLGIKAILKDPKNLVVIEWANRVKKLIPKEVIWIELEHGANKNQRILKIK